MRRILLTTLLVALSVLPVMGGTPAVAQSGNVWTNYYYNNTDWAGNPVLVQNSSVTSFNWGTGSPGPGVPVDNFTGRFETDAFFYAGPYRFTAAADDEVALIVGGVTYIDTRGQGLSGKTQTIDLTFPVQGTQHVTVLYREYTATAYVYVDWQYMKGGSGGSPPPPAPAPTPVPPSQCTPQSATSVQTQFGDYTPCIQQNLHQANCYQSNGAWNAPNMGSVTSEPMIEIWGNCEGDSVTTFQVSCDPEVAPKEYKCSKTWAGWFPN